MTASAFPPKEKERIATPLCCITSLLWLILVLSANIHFRGHGFGF